MLIAGAGQMRCFHRIFKYMIAPFNRSAGLGRKSKLVLNASAVGKDNIRKPSRAVGLHRGQIAVTAHDDPHAGRGLGRNLLQEKYTTYPLCFFRIVATIHKSGNSARMSARSIQLVDGIITINSLKSSRKQLVLPKLRKLMLQTSSHQDFTSPIGWF